MTSSSQISLRSWMVLIAIGILLFLTNIDYTAVNLTLVPIAEEIDADLSTLQWLLSAYVLVWAALVIPAGRLADLYGKRTCLVTGLLIFMGGSVMTGVGQSMEMLIFGRVLQGVGAAVFTAPAWASIFTLTPPEQQGFVMGVIITFCGLGLATGPTIAGFIIQEMSWRWIFYVNIPLGLIVIAILMMYAPKDELPAEKQKIDFVGTFLLVSGLCIAVYGLNQIELLGVASSELWAVIGLGLILIGAFIIWNKRSIVPMVPSHLFRNRPYMAATIGEFFMAMNFSMILVLMALYLQNTLHYSTYETGLIFIAMTLTMGLLSPVGGKLIDLLGIKIPMIFGGFVTAIAMGLMVGLGAESTLPYVLFCLLLAGMGLGTYFTACNTAMLWSAPQKDLNVASGVYMMFMMMGNTLSVILATSLLVLFGRNSLLESSHQHGLELSAQQHHTLVEAISKVEHSAFQLKDFSSDQVPQLLSWIDSAFVYGLSVDMMFGTVFALIAVGLTYWGIGGLKAPVQLPHHVVIGV
ncbi:MAG: MFS transporter [Alphaproteobacteria bacterium]|nr:MFS transporter [Alphaproteobacteria bacterium]